VTRPVCADNSCATGSLVIAADLATVTAARSVSTVACLLQQYLARAGSLATSRIAVYAIAPGSIVVDFAVVATNTSTAASGLAAVAQGVQQGSATLVIDAPLSVVSFMCVRVHACACVCMCACVFVCLFVCLFILFACLFICLRAYIVLYMYMYT
jgi:hypothetical protein